jgi:hypothetical protein
MNLVQFSHGILALDGDVSVHVTEAHPDIDPHPDQLYNPLGNSQAFGQAADALASEQEEVAAARLEAEEAAKAVAETSAAAEDAKLAAEVEAAKTPAKTKK